MNRVVIAIRRRTRGIVLVVAFVCGIARLSIGQTTVQRDAAIDILTSATTFKAAWIGIIGGTPGEVYAWRILVRAHDDKALLRLVHTAHIATQLYGLAGLYVTNRVAFNREIKPFLARGDSAQVLIGCVGGIHPVRTIAQEIRAGIWATEFRSGYLQPHWTLSGFPPAFPLRGAIGIKLSVNLIEYFIDTKAKRKPRLLAS